ncbi:hypothetical protein PJN38_24875 [Mycobacterium kansasii]|uniref:hypothetical protein n=1 Tax=Mycobacterium gordonae TaxID=1778 RepID=UPI001154B2EB|nr:hypothetical protein [Mycobacterium gordonae]MCV7008852.1 hypothetical protein [Mycobacterium gordonae]
MIPDIEPRQPKEAIESRQSDSTAAHDAVRRALHRLINTGAPFKVTDVIKLSGRSKSFIYAHDGRKNADGTPVCELCTCAEGSLKIIVQGAAEVSRGEAAAAATVRHEAHQASYRERAKQAEALAKQLHQQIRERDSVIRDLRAQLRAPDGTLLADKLRQMTKDLATSRSELARAQSKLKRTNDSLIAARANITYEQERNVARLNPRYGVRSRTDG